MREYVELVFERPADSLLTEMGLKKANPRSDFPDPSLGDGKGLFVGEKKFKGGWMSLFQQEIIEEKYNQYYASTARNLFKDHLSTRTHRRKHTQLVLFIQLEF